MQKEQWLIDLEEWMREEQCDSYGESAFWHTIQPARDIIDAHMPKRLYKYVKCDEFSIKTLMDGIVGMTSAIAFNDPFDTLQRLDPKLLEEVYVAHGVVEPQKDPEFGPELSFMKNVQRWAQGSMYVSCFSESVVNMLMWSHYADCHCGFAIGYEFDEGVNAENRKYLFPVIYSDKKYDASWGVYEAKTDMCVGDMNYVRDYMLGLKSALFKSPDWAYEQEWRLVRREADNKGKYSTMPLKPTAIYIGLRMDEMNSKLLKAIAKDLGLEVYQMKIDVSSEGYDMETEKVI